MPSKTFPYTPSPPRPGSMERLYLRPPSRPVGRVGQCNSEADPSGSVKWLKTKRLFAMSAEAQEPKSGNVLQRCVCHSLACCRMTNREQRSLALLHPILSPVAGNIHRQFEPTPHPQFVERGAQVILNHLLGSSNEFADLTIGKPLPNQGGNLNFFRSEKFARGHDLNSTFWNAAVARRTRFRPSRIPARRKRVRKCCLTVRGLMLSCPAISL